MVIFLADITEPVEGVVCGGVRSGGRGREVSGGMNRNFHSLKDL